MLNLLLLVVGLAWRRETYNLRPRPRVEMDDAFYAHIFDWIITEKIQMNPTG